MALDLQVVIFAIFAGSKNRSSRKKMNPQKFTVLGK